MQRWPLNRQKYTLLATSETDLERQEEVIRLKEPDDGARFCQLMCRKRRSATYRLGEHAERRTTDQGQRRVSARRV